jgi:hypothetical protein
LERFPKTEDFPFDKLYCKPHKPPRPSPFMATWFRRTEETTTMSKYDVTPDSASWKELRGHLNEMGAMLGQPQFNLVQFAKVYEASAKTLLKAVKERGMASRRFEAAARALDLHTAKSKLDQFLQD